MTIKVTIQKNSKATAHFKKYMAEKEAFRNAIKSGADMEKYSEISNATGIYYKPSQPLKSSIFRV